MAAPGWVERLRADNASMLVKLGVVVALMFGFGYALVPLYRTICDALGINVLTLSERAAGEGRAGAAAAVGRR